MSETPIWERRPHDTNKSFEAFCIYRDMGPGRSLHKAAIEYYGRPTASIRYIEQWSVDHNWQERVSAYDDYLRDEARKRKEQVRIDIEADALKDYEAIRRAIAKRIKILEATNYTSTPEDLHALISLMEHANHYARLNAGLPDKISESKTDITTQGNAIIFQTGMSLDDL